MLAILAGFCAAITAITVTCLANQLLMASPRELVVQDNGTNKRKEFSLYSLFSLLRQLSKRAGSLWRKTTLHGAIAAIALGFVLALLGVPIVIILVAIAGGILCRRALKSRRKRREAAHIDSLLVPFLDDTARSIRSGLLAPQALLQAAKQVMQAQREVDSLTTEDFLAWFNYTYRTTKSTEVCRILHLGDKLGGLTAEFTYALSAIVSTDLQLLSEVRSQAAQAKMSGLVMSVAPIVFFCALVLTDSRARHLMLNTPIGTVLIGVGCGLDLAAWYWMNRIAQRVEVA